MLRWIAEDWYLLTAPAAAWAARGEAKEVPRDYLRLFLCSAVFGICAIAAAAASPLIQSGRGLTSGMLPMLAAFAVGMAVVFVVLGLVAATCLDGAVKLLDAQAEGMPALDIILAAYFGLPTAAAALVATAIAQGAAPWILLVPIGLAWSVYAIRVLRHGLEQCYGLPGGKASVLALASHGMVMGSLVPSVAWGLTGFGLNAA